MRDRDGGSEAGKEDVREGDRDGERGSGGGGGRTNDEAWQSHRRVPAWFQNDAGLVKHTQAI